MLGRGGGGGAKGCKGAGQTLVETTVGGSWQGSPTKTAASQLHSRGIRDAGSVACTKITMYYLTV